MTVIEAINDTAKALANLSNALLKEQSEIAKEEVVPKKKSVTKQLFDPNPKKKEATVTIEQVRAVLAEKSQAGFTIQVKELLEKFGANKLSAISPDDYAAVMEAATAIS